MRVCLEPGTILRYLSKNAEYGEGRFVAGFARVAGAEDSGAARAAARVRDHDRDRGDVERGAAGGGGIALSGAASDGGGGVDPGGVGGDGGGAAGADLFVDGGGSEAASGGGIAMECGGGGGGAGAAEGVVVLGRARPGGRAQTGGSRANRGVCPTDRVLRMASGASDWPRGAHASRRARLTTRPGKAGTTPGSAAWTGCATAT